MRRRENESGVRRHSPGVGHHLPFLAGGLWFCAHFAGATGFHQASEEGKSEMTTAPWS